MNRKSSAPVSPESSPYSWHLSLNNLASLQVFIWHSSSAVKFTVQRTTEFTVLLVVSCARLRLAFVIVAIKTSLLSFIVAAVEISRRG